MGIQGWQLLIIALIVVAVLAVAAITVGLLLATRRRPAHPHVVDVQAPPAKPGAAPAAGDASNSGHSPNADHGLSTTASHPDPQR